MKKIFGIFLFASAIVLASCGGGSQRAAEEVTEDADTVIIQPAPVAPVVTPAPVPAPVPQDAPAVTPEDGRRDDGRRERGDEVEQERREDGRRQRGDEVEEERREDGRRQRGD